MWLASIWNELQGIYIGDEAMYLKFRDSYKGRHLAVTGIWIIGMVMAASAVRAGDPTTELLWPEGAPGAVGNESGDKPTMISYLPEAGDRVGAAVVVCPGGGYGGLAMDHEGHAIARWFNSFGVVAVICDYRHRGKGYGHPAPLQDAQRAVRTVRHRAEALDIHPSRIGILGFSAGGHLASTVATHFDAGQASAEDPIERVSCRPDFAILCYPVIALGESFTHGGSQRNLLGDNAPAELIRSLSNEKQVSSQSPPTFLWHTAEDRGVPPENSVHYYLALQRAGVPAELHVYEKGRHGLGLAADVPGTSGWPDACRQWMAGRGLLQK
jgi:acetyl esterase/lipase